MPVNNEHPVPPGRIAFVHYPHGSNSWIEARPFAFNLVKKLADAGWRVDLFLWEERLPHIEAFCCANNIQLFYASQTNLGRVRRRLRPLTLAVRFAFRRGYRCVFTAGQIASYIGALIARASRCPLVCLNDEFPSFWGNGLLVKLEGWAMRRAQLIVMPDQEGGLRYPELERELGLPPDTPHVDIPNSPLIEQTLGVDCDWHARLGIPPGMKLFMHAGSLGDWTQIPEILSSIPYWPEGVGLLLHCHSHAGFERYRQQMEHLSAGYPVFWSSGPLPDVEFNSLVAYVDGCFALYRNTGPNLELMGMSTGKLMRSLACGTPVIASHQASLSFVETQRVGILVRHPVEIPRAIESLLQDREGWRERCSEYCLKGEGSFDGGWRRLLAMAPKALDGLDFANTLS